MKIEGKIDLTNKKLYIWKVYGANGHRLKNSFSESYVMSMEDFRPVIIAEINSDLTDSNLYNYFAVFAESEKAATEEFEGQLYDGAYENSNTGIVERVF